MRIGTWNILFGSSLRDGANLFEAIREYNLDVLGVQEVDHLQPRSNHSKLVEEIAEHCGYPYWIFVPTLYGTHDAPLKAKHHRAHDEKVELPTSYGIGLVSRIPIKSYEILRLKKAPFGLPLPVASAKGARLMYVRDEDRAAIAATLENGMTIIITHLSFVPPFNSSQLRKIKQWAKKFAGPTILMGDLNGLILGAKKSLNPARSYPGWKPSLKFDYILDLSGEANEAQTLELPYLGVSDHLPLGVELPTLNM